jgi:hypothetical protein
VARESPVHPGRQAVEPFCKGIDLRNLCIDFINVEAYQ